MTRYTPLDIINDHLLDGHEDGGRALRHLGEMQLPFVLQSAEVMKSAVAYLEPYDGTRRRFKTQGERSCSRP